MAELAGKCAEALETVRQKRPLVHNITNYVVMNFTANVLLCTGASPVMAHAVEEVEEMVSIANALVLNIGTLSRAWIEAMLRAGRRARSLGVPIILDPVGAGATRLRTDASVDLLEQVRPVAVRGNASEIIALARGDAATRGVDSAHVVDDAAGAALELAARSGTVV
ncbi:hydroxyethylthiazole kinase, partial [Candidatus Fermentibacterales bacterium]|nr:hydroxyethylthiazole kinase [Candidatus Fermentibacterales bacterium]